MFLNFEEAAVLGQGIRISSEDPPLILNIKDHGDIIQRRWFAIGITGYGPKTSHWHEHDDATAGIATATKTAAVGFTHHVTHVSGGYEDIGQTGSLDLLSDVTTLNDWAVGISFGPNLLEPISCVEGEKAEVILSAGGVGIVGHVNIGGYTTLGGLGFGTIKTYEGVFNLKEHLNLA